MMNRGRVRSGSSSGSPVKTVYTYVQPDGKKYGHVHTYRRGLERVLAHTYGQGLCPWRGNGRQQRRPVHRKPTGWVGTEKLHRVHREATECVVFIGRQRNTSCSSGANRLGPNSRNKVWCTAEWRKRALCSTAYGQNGVLFIGMGLAYRKMEETDLCSSA